MIAWRVETHDVLDSTSDTCIARAKAGEPEGLAVMAARQTAGRGSRGRNWLSPPGNLAFSVLLRPDSAPADSGIFPFLAGIAVAEAVSPLVKPGLKWPNDVLVDGAKLAGLLIDAAPLDGRMDWLVIGIGLNIAYAPEIPGRLTTCLAAHGAETSPVAIANAILSQLNIWLEVFTTDGPAAIQQRWLALAHPVGTPLLVRGQNAEIAGTFAGLSASGELLLQVEHRIEKFQTGEVLGF